MNGVHQVVAATPLDGMQVRVSFDNGVGGIFDCSPYVKDKYWASLANPVFFRQVRVDCGTLCWPNDIDIDPEEVWEDCVKEKSEP